MIQLNKALQAWGSDTFPQTFKQEVLQLDTGLLPLQQGLSHGNYASDENLSIMILDTREDIDNIHVKTGIFYTGIITGCHCADDPSPNNELAEYCEVMFDINRQTAETGIHLLSD